MIVDRPKNMSFLDFAGGTQLLHGEYTKTVLPVILLGVSVTGVFGNLLVLLLVVHDFRKGRGSEVKTLLASLSSTDLLILLLCAPVRALTYHRHTWTLGRFICKTADWFQHSCLVAKTLLLAVSSNARHNFVSNTSKGVFFSTRKMYGALVLIWSASLLFPIPQIIFASLQPYYDINLCVYEMPGCASDFMNVFYKVYPAAAFVIPIIFTLAYYTRAMLNTKPKGKAPSPQQQGKVIQLLLCVSGANALMLLPEWVAWTWTRLGHSNPPVSFVIFAQVFLYACSSLCPIIFLTMYDGVRQGLNAMWLVITCRGSKHLVLSRAPKVEGNGSGIGGPMVIHSQVDLECASLSTRPEDVEGAGKTFPDLEHFWTERRNMAVEEDHDDPIPWER